jgi:drug/metabolite transporter (DMT)-like permease
VRTHTQNLIRLHIIVVLYGFTAILGRLISLDASVMVWYRMLIAVTLLAGYAWYKGNRFAIPQTDLLKLAVIGMIVALHWITFFRAIKISTVSVALGTFASTTLFASFLEPLILKRRIRIVEVLIGLIIIGGLYLIFRFETNYTEGILTALFSAFLASLFTILNQTFTHKYPPVEITVIELASGLVTLSGWFLLSMPSWQQFPLPNWADVFWLMLLAVVCTAYAFVVGVDIMKTISPYVVVLTINLEPVYSIILAYFIFGDTEHMSVGFYLGTLVILGAVFAYPYIMRIRASHKRNNATPL